MTSASVLVAAVLQVLHAKSIRHLQPCPHAGNLHGAQFLHYSQPHPLSRGIPILTCTSRSPTPRAAQKTPIFNFLHCSRIPDNCVNVFDHNDFMYNNFLVYILVSTYFLLKKKTIMIKPSFAELFVDMYTARRLGLGYHVCLGTAQSQVASIPRLFTPRTILQEKRNTHLKTMT